MGRATGTKNAGEFSKCADCRECKVYRDYIDGGNGDHYLKIKCALGHWSARKNTGNDYGRALARRRMDCENFRSMSDGPEDRAAFLAQLDRDLSRGPMRYNYNGEPVDLT